MASILMIASTIVGAVASGLAMLGGVLSAKDQIEARKKTEEEEDTEEE